MSDISSVSLDDKIQIINNVAYEISNQTPILQISVLLSISLRLETDSNSLKSNLNNLMIEEAGMEKNIPYIILNQVLIDQIISSDIPFKSPEWNPTSLSIFIPDNNMLKFDLNLPHSVLLLVPDTEYNVMGIYSGNNSSNIYKFVYKRNDILVEL